MSLVFIYPPLTRSLRRVRTVLKSRKGSVGGSSFIKKGGLIPSKSSNQPILYISCSPPSMSVARNPKWINHCDFFIHRKIPVIIRRYLFDAVREHGGDQIRVKNPIGCPRVLMHKYNGDGERFFGWSNDCCGLGNGIHCFFRL